jgi:hypothetical protein
MAVQANPSMPAGTLECGTLVTSTAQGAGTQVSPDQVNINCRGIVVGVNITVAGGTPTYTVKIQGKDPVSGQYYDLLTSAALASVAFTALTLYPGVTVAANVAVSAPLPSQWRISVTTGGTTPAITATISATLLP